MHFDLKVLLLISEHTVPPDFALAPFLCISGVFSTTSVMRNARKGPQIRCEKPVLNHSFAQLQYKEFLPEHGIPTI
jgi:hypothetical protein